MGDLLDFADMIGPGGKGLKRDRAESDDEDDDDSDEDEDDLDDIDISEGEDEETDEDADADPDDLISEGEPSELDDGIQSSQEEAEIDLSENETPATKYVPPHMRAAQLAEKAQGSKEKALSRQKLERKLQGLLNK
jgi:nucleolar MIF4G domain-containing protein 1